MSLEGSIRLKKFDHVSIAVDSIEEGYKLFRDQLGGEVIRGPVRGYNGEFSWAEIMLGGSKIELIQPEGDDSFVRKFLRGVGSKIHHLTFEVDNLEESVKALEVKGFTMIGKTTEDPEWNIAFIDPKSAKGVLIQLFESKAK